MRTLHWICLVVVIIGALNWGLWGLFAVDLVATVFGGPTAALSRIIYVLVGIAGLVIAFTSPALILRHRHIDQH